MRKYNELPKIKWVLVGFISMSLFGVACSKKSESSPEAPLVATTPGSTPPNSNSGISGGFKYTGGGTVAFVPSSMSAMNAYVGSHPLNYPTNIQLNVNLNDLGGGRFGGILQLSYTDNGQNYNGYFESGTGTVGVSLNYSGLSEAEFNQWFLWNGQRVFHAFFQDKSGAVILVIDDALAGADGGLARYVGGSVYFKNFAPQNCAYPPPMSVGCGQSALKCWFIDVGPFSCQTFLSGGIVSTTSALYPSANDGYIKLGTFTGLDYKAAFNIP